MSINTSGDCRYALEALSSSCWSTEPCSCDDTPRYFKGSANTVAQFSSNPGKHHWDAVIRIIRYLRTTRNWVLTLGRKSASVELLGYCDADHANSPAHGPSI